MSSQTYRLLLCLRVSSHGLDRVGRYPLVEWIPSRVGYLRLADLAPPRAIFDLIRELIQDWGVVLTPYPRLPMPMPDLLLFLLRQRHLVGPRHLTLSSWPPCCSICNQAFDIDQIKLIYAWCLPHSPACLTCEQKIMTTGCPRSVTAFSNVDWVPSRMPLRQGKRTSCGLVPHQLSIAFGLLRALSGRAYGKVSPRCPWSIPRLGGYLGVTLLLLCLLPRMLFVVAALPMMLAYGKRSTT